MKLKNLSSYENFLNEENLQHTDMNFESFVEKTFLKIDQLLDGVEYAANASTVFQAPIKEQIRENLKQTREQLKQDLQYLHIEDQNQSSEDAREI